MSLINAAMLLGFAALSIPVVIHLLKSQRFQQAQLGSILGSPIHFELHRLPPGREQAH